MINVYKVPRGRGGGTCEKFDRETHVFFGYEIYENIIFLVLLSRRHFLGLKKLASFFCFINNLHHFFGLLNFVFGKL